MNSIIYEINTRVWIKQFSNSSNQPKLLEVPQNYWQKLKEKGIKYIWLMGIWKTVPSTVEKYCFVDGLVKEYDLALPDWRSEDVIGSPYSIDRYEINPELGTREELVKLKERLNQLGFKLILDFIPNHFSAETSLLKEVPDIFLQVNMELYKHESVIFFKSNINGEYYAHGKDPYFDAWQDTIQLDYFNPVSREYMTDVLLNLTDLCDGVRCDMAMLMLNSVFSNTWSNVLNSSDNSHPETEFWSDAISCIKNIRSEFIFIAEAYWDLEYNLQQLGFDYTYDKQLYDRLLKSNPNSIIEHLKADIEFQNKSVRFIENHDEPRASKAFGKKSKAAAVIMSTIPGLKLYFDGQFEGKKVKLPVQLGRKPDETLDSDLNGFYDHLLSTLKKHKITEGKFKILEPVQAFDDNGTNKNILAWLWENDQNKFLVVINYSSETSVCRIKTEFSSSHEEIVLYDLLNGKEYSRLEKEVIIEGLYIQLEPYSSHIFTF